jgi:hypothetical protein
MKAQTLIAIGSAIGDPNLIRALEILSGSAGDIPMEGKTRHTSMRDQYPGPPEDCEAAGDIPWAPGTVAPLLLRFSANADLDQEIFFQLYRRSVVSAWADGPAKDAALGGIDHRFETLRPLFQPTL